MLREVRVGWFWPRSMRQIVAVVSFARPAKVLWLKPRLVLKILTASAVLVGAFSIMPTGYTSLRIFLLLSFAI